jgi:hypothetical protein
MYYDFIVFDWNPVAGLGAWYILSTMANWGTFRWRVSAQKKGPTPLQCRPPNNQTNQPLTSEVWPGGKTKNPPSLVQGL